MRPLTEEELDDVIYVGLAFVVVLIVLGALALAF